MITLLVIVALVIVGLELNRRRQCWPRDPGPGSTDVPDRDLQRLVVDLRAMADQRCANW
jgi:hypothetical protein